MGHVSNVPGLTRFNPPRCQTSLSWHVGNVPHFYNGLLAATAGANEDKRGRTAGADYRVVGMHARGHHTLAVDEEVVHGIIQGGPGKEADAEILEEDVLSATTMIETLVVG